MEENLELRKKLKVGSPPPSAACTVLYRPVLYCPYWQASTGYSYHSKTDRGLVVVMYLLLSLQHCASKEAAWANGDVHGMMCKRRIAM